MDRQAGSYLVDGTGLKPNLDDEAMAERHKLKKTVAVEPESRVQSQNFELQTPNSNTGTDTKKRR